MLNGGNVGRGTGRGTGRGEIQGGAQAGGEVQAGAQGGAWCAVGWEGQEARHSRARSDGAQRCHMTDSLLLRSWERVCRQSCCPTAGGAVMYEC